MRKHYGKGFKAKVAAEAIRGEKTIQEIATSHAVHPNLVSLWKKQLLKSAGTVFEKKGRIRRPKRSSVAKGSATSRSASFWARMSF